MKIVVVLFSIFVCVYGHGYSLVPQARHNICFEGQSHVPGLWAEFPGNSIPDPACRAAFNHVDNKGRDGRYQFTYRFDYSNNNLAPGHDRNNYPNIVPSGEICSAGRNSASNDKTGISILAPWRSNTIYTNNIDGYETLDFQYCATAPHNPATWHVYYQKGDPQTTIVSWDNLVYLGETGDIQPKVSPVALPNCFSLGQPHNIYYEFEMAVPMHAEGGTIVVIWQRIDPHGEFFMNCVDIKAKLTGVLPIPPPPSDACVPETCQLGAFYPDPDPRRYNQCRPGGPHIPGQCNTGTYFTTRNGGQCYALPVALEHRWPCQDWTGI